MDSNSDVGIDLHIHTTASDGSYSPADVVYHACQLQLGAIAITDHDTIDGVKAVLGGGIPADIHFITGVEISASPPAGFDCSGSFHILGYGFDVNHPGLNQTLRTLQEARKNRNPQILKRLHQLGIHIDLNELRRFAGDGQVGRPHIAQIMVEKGYAASIDDAFDNYIGKGQKAYVDKYRLGAEAAINAISAAGGVAVLAHPQLIQLTIDTALEDLVHAMKSFGLRGIEVYYPEHTPQHIDHFITLAHRYDLLMTGGTDFHGELKPEIRLGVGAGDLFIPFRLYQSLIASF